VSLSNSADYLQAREAALRLLAYRPRSEAEVRRRLQQRFSPALVEAVVQQLKEQRLLDDAAFALQWRQERERRRPKARGMVRQELRRLGVSPQVAQAALEGFDDAANARRAGQRLVRRLSGTPERDFQQRVAAYLQRRGFGYTLSAQTAKRLWMELADPLHGDDNPRQDEQQPPDVKTEGPHHPADEERGHHCTPGQPGQRDPPFPVGGPAN
jgi:regulatory protein